MKGRIKRQQPQKESLSRLGFIKCGEKTADGRPTSLDYFKATGKYAPLFHEVYGEKPNQITIFFPSNNMEDVAEERYELRDNAGKLVAFGDGEEFHVHNRETNEYDRTEGDVLWMGKMAAKYNTEKYTGKWDATLSLTFFIPGVKVYGVWKLVTKGDDSSIPNIVSTLDKLMKFPGRIVGIPMDLVVEKVKSNKPGSKSVFPVINLIPNLTQGAMEKLHALIQQGVQYEGMLLSDERVDALSAQAQIEPPKETKPIIEAEIVEPTPAEAVEKKFAGPAPIQELQVLREALVELEAGATSAQALKLIGAEIWKRQKWSAADTKALDAKYKELVAKL